MKKAKIFKNGQSQAVRLPKEFRFRGNEVFIRRIGNVVVLLSEDQPWLPLIESLSRFSSDFLEKRKQPGEQKRKGIFS